MFTTVAATAVGFVLHSHSAPRVLEGDFRTERRLLQARWQVLVSSSTPPPPFYRPAAFVLPLARSLKRCALLFGRRNKWAGRSEAGAGARTGHTKSGLGATNYQFVATGRPELASRHITCLVATGINFKPPAG